jgi:hypothetical protein
MSKSETGLVVTQRQFYEKVNCDIEFPYLTYQMIKKRKLVLLDKKALEQRALENTFRTTFEVRQFIREILGEKHE